MEADMGTDSLTFSTSLALSMCYKTSKLETVTPFYECVSAVSLGPLCYELLVAVKPGFDCKPTRLVVSPTWVCYQLACRERFQRDVFQHPSPLLTRAVRVDWCLAYKTDDLLASKATFGHQCDGSVSPHCSVAPTMQ